jgi:hypothetical protein
MKEISKKGDEKNEERMREEVRGDEGRRSRKRR